MGCLDDEMIYELVRGQLDDDAMAAADSHIDTCADCRELIAGVAQCGASGTTGSEVVVRRGSVVGGKYVVLDVVGGGASGIVHAAWDAELERHVALKVLSADAHDADRRARFVREAQAMAKLSHPNVVAVFEVGQIGDRVFIAMELVRGQTLRDWSARVDKRHWRQVRDVLVQAGRGLAAAHAAGLVHRDVKPDNVIVGDDGRVRVTDFGLVRGEAGSIADAQGADAELALTVTGTVMGTPAYMAPEQFRGELADGRSDQYAFCATMWEAVYGQRPFVADTFEQLAGLVSAGRVPAAPPIAPRWLRGALAQGLSVNPGERFASMTELLDALGRDVRATPGRRIAVGIAVAGVGIAAALILGDRPASAPPMCTGAAAAVEATWNAGRADQVRSALGASESAYAAATAELVVAAADQWRRDWVAAHTAACRATRVSGEQSDALLDARMRCLDHRRVELDAVVAQLARDGATTVTSATATIAQLPAVDRCADADVLGRAPIAPAEADALRPRIAAGRALVATGQYGAAVDQLEPVVADATATAFEPVVAEATLALATAQQAAGRARTAKPLALDAVIAAERSGADYTAARAWIALVRIEGELGDLVEAAEQARHAGAAVARVGRPSELLARLDHARGVIDYNLGRYERAEQALRRALALRTDAFGDGHPVLAGSYTSLGNLELARRQYDNAIAHHRKALSLDKVALGEAHPNVGRHLHNIAGVLRAQGQIAAARDYYARALAIKRAALGDGHVEVALTRNSLGLVELDAGELDVAAALFAAAHGALDAAGHPNRAVASHNLGLVAAARGDHAASIAQFERALDIYPRRGRRAARALLALGRAYLARDDRASARDAYVRAEDIARGLDDDALTNLARVGRTAATPQSGKPRRPARKPPPGDGVYAPGQTWE